MMRYVPLVLATLASFYIGSLFSSDFITLTTFSSTILATLVLALLIRLAWSRRLYDKIEGSPPDNGRRS